MKSKAAVMYESGQPLKIDEVDVLPPGPRECLVKIESTSVCASDFNGWRDESTPTPCILGHEGAGTIVEVGELVSAVAVGDQVCLSWLPSCGHCRFCARGQRNQCSTVIPPMFNGTLFDEAVRFRKNEKNVYHFSFLSTFSQYTVVPEASCIKLKEEVSADIRALLGCGVATGYGAATIAADITPDKNVLVFSI